MQHSYDEHVKNMCALQQHDAGSVFCLQRPTCGAGGTTGMRSRVRIGLGFGLELGSGSGYASRVLSPPTWREVQSPWLACVKGLAAVALVATPVSTLTKFSGVTSLPFQSIWQSLYTSTPGVPSGVGLLNILPGKGFSRFWAMSSTAMTMMFDAGIPFDRTT